MITVTLNDKRHIAAVNAAYLATIPAEGEAPYTSPQEYVQARVEDVATSWAESTNVDRIPVSSFVRRFSGAVLDTINASTDPVVLAILAQLDAVQTVRLGHPTTVNGVGYLVGAGLLTQEEADAVLHYDIPQVP